MPKISKSVGWFIVGFIVGIIGIPMITIAMPSHTTNTPFYLRHPESIPIVAIGTGLFAVALHRKELSKQKSDNKERRKSVNTLPAISPYDSDPYPSYGFPTVITPSPETEIAAQNPVLAADLLKQLSLDRSLVDLANSSVATEFARQGRGTFAASRRRKHFFGGESTEHIIKPV